jgi:UDP-2-acetamido-3-amino-2,3-dideoxy-glucuronate N-acetyltransferase
VVNPRAFINRKQEFKKTIVKRGASLGAHTTVICGNTIGKYALIGAGSVITKNVADFELWYGNPAKKHGVVDKEGNKVI